jgi:leucyl-tRNA synthetase
VHTESTQYNPSVIEPHWQAFWESDKTFAAVDFSEKPPYYVLDMFLYPSGAGLAYVDEKPVWWCSALGTVIANEEIVDGLSERGNHPIERRNLRQWVLRITAYADKLLEDIQLARFDQASANCLDCQV